MLNVVRWMFKITNPIFTNNMPMSITGFFQRLPKFSTIKAAVRKHKVLVVAMVAIGALVFYLGFLGPSSGGASATDLITSGDPGNLTRFGATDLLPNLADTTSTNLCGESLSFDLVQHQF